MLEFNKNIRPEKPKELKMDFYGNGKLRHIEADKNDYEALGKLLTGIGEIFKIFSNISNKK